MKRWHLILVLATLAAVPMSANAGILFKKATKPNPADRVPELIGIVKTEKDEHKRASAAEEMRQYDANTYPEIIMVLADVLLSDASASVRAEAADSLARLRPVAQSAGLALEQALAKDSSMKVRMQARYALLQYHWAGYHSNSKDAPLIQPKDQPVAKEGKPVIQMPLKPQQTGARFGETPPPPPAPPVDPPVIPTKLPKGPVQAPLVPTDPPVLKAPPLAPPAPPPAPTPNPDQGPDLTPPEE
jgi:hypothetical protein